MHRVVIVSDIHYASDSERHRREYEARVIRTGSQRLIARVFRHYVWLKDPFAHNYLLEDFCAAAGEADAVVANGDYSCDSAFVGVSDDAACTSARHVLDRLRTRFPNRLEAVFGDHELGKTSLFGGVGGPRLASWHRAIDELGLKPFWRLELGDHILVGVVSSLVALPVFEPETLPAERAEWWHLRESHLDAIRTTFRRLAPHQRVVLFCHDPTAIPFLAREAEIRDRLARLECTVIGHLHTPLVLWKSRLLAGMPVIRFLGNSVRRMSTALREARWWRAFKVRLCPSLAGCQLLKDGGFCSLELPADGRAAVQWRFHPLPWRQA